MDNRKWWQQQWMNIIKNEERGLMLMHLNWRFGIGAIFVPVIVRKNLTGMSTAPVKGVHQEKLKSSIGSAVNRYTQTYAGKNMHESNMETDSISATDKSSYISDYSNEDQRDDNFETLEPADSTENKEFSEDDEIPSNRMEKTIVKAVLKALQIIENPKASHQRFEDILNFGKQLFYEGLGEECDMDIVDAVWPSSWEEAQIILRRAGYENPKEYFVCFCRKKAKGIKIWWKEICLQWKVGYHVWEKTNLQTL